MMCTADFNLLIDNRSDPDVRAVLEDVELTMGHRSTRLGLALSYISDDGDDVADAADSADSGDAAADDAVDSVDAGDSDAAAGDSAADSVDAGDSDAAAGDSDDAIQRHYTLLTKDPDMREGLKIIQVPGRYASWAVTRVGWIRRVRGDEYELVEGARTIIRTGAPRTIDDLAARGPGGDHALTDPSLGTEDLHRLSIRRCLPANEAVWAKYCPRPAGWVGDGEGDRG